MDVLPLAVAESSGLSIPFAILNSKGQRIGVGKGKWLRGMAKWEWVKGMDSALFTARAACCVGCAAATSRMCSPPLWNKWNFRLFHLLHSGLFLDHRGGFRLWTVAELRPLRAFLKKLKILN